MKLLHLEIKSCMSCPYMAIVGDTGTTIVACRNGLVSPATNPFNARTILEQSISHVPADVEIPEWCPLECTEKELPEDSILSELGAAFERHGRVTVTFSGTTEEHEYTGYIKGIDTVMTRSGSGIEHIISFGHKTVGPIMYLSEIKEVLIKAEPPTDDIAPELLDALYKQIMGRYAFERGDKPEDLDDCMSYKSELARLWRESEAESSNEK